MHQLDKLVKNICIPKKYLNNLIQIGYNRTVFKISLMLWMLTNKKNPYINMTISEISKYAGISKSNVRYALDRMVKMKLINYIDIPIGLRIEVLYLSTCDNSYIRLPLVFLSKQFLKLPLITQRICLYVTLNGYAISKDNGKNLFIDDMVKLFGDSNKWRLQKYLYETEKFLQIKTEKKCVQEVRNDMQNVYIYKWAYNVRIGNFIAGSNQLEYCKQSNIKDKYCIKYVKDILQNNCEYSFIRKENKDWINFINNNGQDLFIYAASLVGKGRKVETSMPRYFGGLIKKLKKTA